MESSLKTTDKFSERRILVRQTLVRHVKFKTPQQQKESPFFLCFLLRVSNQLNQSGGFKYVLIFTRLGEMIQFD